MVRHIVALAFDGITLSDLVTAVDTFHLTSMPLDFHLKGKYQVSVASMGGGSVNSMSKLAIETVALESLDSNQIDTLIVAGGGPPQRPPIPKDLVAWLRSNAANIRRVCGVCTGSFLLAEAGLLEGKRVTTHWQAAKLLKQNYKNIDVDVESIFIRDGQIWTSAGFSAVTDLMLALIEEDEGHDTSVELAKTMVLYLKRSGDQSQVSIPLSYQEKSDYQFSKLHAWIVDNLTMDLSLELLAEKAKMSPRTFVRRYKESLGCTPAKTVEAIRIEYACDSLATTNDSIKHIAYTSGFGNPQNMRRAFIRSLGMSPQEFRSSRQKR